MVNNLIDAFNKMKCAGFDMNNIDVTTASALLGRLEHEGIIPPNSFHEFKHMGSNEWEPEDEDS